MKKLAVIFVSLLVVACSSTSKTSPSPASQMNGNGAASGPAATAESGNLTAGAQTSQEKSVYFEFDRSSIEPEYRAAIQKEAELIRSHKSDIVTLEGNCDERGSAEYNLALGQRRANAVKKLLMVAGVRAKQIKTVSLGKEKLKLSCHEEKCWKEDRRVDFVHSS